MEIVILFESDVLNTVIDHQADRFVSTLRGNVVFDLVLRLKEEQKDDLVSQARGTQRCQIR